MISKDDFRATLKIKNKDGQWREIMMEGYNQPLGALEDIFNLSSTDLSEIEDVRLILATDGFLNDQWKLVVGDLDV